MNNAKSVTKSIAAALLDEWMLWGIDERPKQITQLAEGTRHKSFLLSSANDHYVLRIKNRAAAQILNEKKQPAAKIKPSHLAASSEKHAHTLASAIGVAPNIIYQDQSQHYRVSEYIHGNSLNSEQLAGKKLSKRDLATLCKMVQRYQSLDGNSSNIQPINYTALLGDYKQLLITAGLWRADDQRAFNQNLATIERLDILHLNAPRTLCHHDLNAANIIRISAPSLFKQSPTKDLDQIQTFSILDWEYACLSYPCMDFAILAEEFDIAIEHIAVFARQIPSTLKLAASLYRYLCQLYWRIESINHSNS